MTGWLDDLIGDGVSKSSVFAGEMRLSIRVQDRFTSGSVAIATGVGIGSSVSFGAEINALCIVAFGWINSLNTLVLVRPVSFG